MVPTTGVSSGRYDGTVHGAMRLRREHARPARSDRPVVPDPRHLPAFGGREMEQERTGYPNWKEIMDSETFAAYESGCTCWRLVDQYVGWVEQPTEMLGITIFTGAMPDGERLPGLPSRYEAFRLVMKALDRYILGDSDPLHLDLGSPDSMYSLEYAGCGAEAVRGLRERHPHGDMLILNQNGHLLTDKDFE